MICYFVCSIVWNITYYNTCFSTFNVEKSIDKFGSPVFVRHEIVNNKHVVDSLTKKGAIFVDEISDIPENSHTIFSAHGVSDKVENDAKIKSLSIVDTTCPYSEGYDKVLNGNFSTSNAILILLNIKRWDQISPRVGILADYFDSKKYFQYTLDLAH